MKDISVSIVAYKDYDDIETVVSSLEKHTSGDINKQIYIVDNSCLNDEDEGKKHCQEQLAAYPDVTYIDTRKNLGFGSGHNVVLKEIDSRYHAIVNPDVIINEDVLEKIIAFMDQHEEVGMCIPRILDDSGELQKAYRKELTVTDMFIRFFCKPLFPRRVKSHTLQDMDYSKPFQVPFAQGCFLVIRTDLFRQLGGFDENFFMYLEDADLSKRVNEVSSVYYFPGASVIHKWEQGSHKNPALFKIHVASMKYYFKKWGVKF